MNLEKLRSSQAEERQRQQQQVAKQLQLRHERQLRGTKHQQQMELAELERQKEASVAQIESKSNKQRDMAALRRVLSSNVAHGAKGAAIEGVLRKRHTAETRQMLERQFNERNARLRVAMGIIMQDKATEKRDMLAMLEDGSASAEEMEAALMDLNEKFTHSIQVCKQEIQAELEAKHAAEAAEQRRTQMAELTDAFAQLSPQDVLRRQQAAEREEQAARTEAIKKRLLLEREKKLEAAAKLRSQKRAEMQRAKAVAQEQLQEEMDAHLQAEQKRAALQLKRQQDRLESETAERMKEQLGLHDGDEEYKQRLMQELKQEQAAMTVALNAERQRQATSMHQRLSKRKERRLRAEERRLAKESRLFEKAELKKNSRVNAKPQSEARTACIRLGAGAAQSQVRGTPKAVPNKPAASPQAGRQPHPSGAGLFSSRPAAQAVLLRIEKIEKLLEAIASSHQALILPAVQLTPQPVADVFEAHVAIGTTLREAIPDLLASEEKRMLSFGKDFLATLARDIVGADAIKRCCLAAATELPVATADGNAFRRSYWYDNESNTLFVHTKRLNSASGLPQMLVHAAAHMLCDPATMGPDSNAAFQAMRTQVMQAALNHLIEAVPQHLGSHRSPPSRSDTRVMSPALSSTELAAGFQHSEEPSLVPQLTLNFGIALQDSSGVKQSTSSAPQPTKQSVRAARLLRSLSSKSGLLGNSSTAAAVARAAKYKQTADGSSS
jgi:hypothetical protein